ncbi:hypothetical protein M0813_00029 [Anaeramoeba flamelloides]|uniref:Uncharacterized protein n=1 Tax=Anaeramoeba flamelloides TaxID=1746091 RepID=A0ABQ8YWE4_9EUKA|nr:hypothetical protein M0813_00029 [Anaeramoeba flamelloides]
MNKLCCAFLFFVLFVPFTFCCTYDSDCQDEGGKPRCVDKKCVECKTSMDCSRNKYCHLEDHECLYYADDNKIGKFCNSDDCRDQSTNVVCGRCENGETYWSGFCTEFKCYECDASDPDSGIAGEHESTKCYPSSASGRGGVVSSFRKGGSEPRYVLQDSAQIGLLIFGIGIGLILVLNCIIIFRAK